jgi:hypothetical protein
MQPIHSPRRVVALADIPMDSSILRASGWMILLLGLVAGMLERTQAGTITNTLPGRTLVRMVSDPGRGVVYALNSGTAATSGSLLTLDSTTGAILREVETARLCTDLSLAPEGDSLYVISTGNRTIARYGLDPVSLISTRSIQTPGTYDSSLPLRMAVTAGSTIYFTDAAWAPRVLRLDFASGVQTTAFDDSNGAGALAVTRDGHGLYLWHQIGWGAGSTVSRVLRLDDAGGAWKAVETSTFPLSRDPLESPILLDVAEQRLFVKQYAVDARNLSRIIRDYPEWIFGASADGSVVSGTTRLFDVETGAVLATWAAASSVQAFSGDQRSLFRWVPGTGLMVHDLQPIIALTGPEPTPIPADGNLLPHSPAKLGWNTSRPAKSFDVFLSTNAQDVATADKASPGFLGGVTAQRISLSNPLTPGVDWYWRIHMHGYDGQVRTGKVWSFRISPLDIRPDRVRSIGFAGHDVPDSELRFGTSLQNWTARVRGDNWLTVVPGMEGGTAKLTLKFNTASLPLGVQRNAVEVTSGNETVVIPVEIEVVTLNLNRMIADPGAPRIYATQASSGTGRPGYLLVFGTDDGKLIRHYEIGANPTDLTFHPQDRKVFVANWGLGSTEVLDADTLALLPPLNLGTDVFRVNPAGPGRIVIEGLDQWVHVTVVNWRTGGAVQGFNHGQREGDSETSPDGRILYRADNNISNAAIRSYSLVDGSGPLREGQSFPFGSRTLVLSGDGTRLFWQLAVFDADLRTLGLLTERILASSRDGSVAFSQQTAFDVKDLKAMAPLPAVSTAMTVDASDGNLWYFDSQSGSLQSVSLSSLKAPRIATQPPEVTRTVRGGAVYIAVDTQGLAPLTYQWYSGGLPVPGATNRFLTLNAVSTEAAGSYQLHVSNPFGTVESRPAAVVVDVAPEFTRHPVSTNIPAGGNLVLSAELTGTEPLRLTWTLNGLPVSGGTGSVLTVPIIQVHQQGLYELRATNAVGTALSRPALVRVLPAAPSWTLQPTSITARENASVTFRSGVLGTFPMTFRWWRDDTLIPAPNSQNLTLSNIMAAQEGWYRVAASNGEGSITSAPVRLVVERTAPFIIGLPVDQWVREGSNAVFNAVVEGALPLTYQWFFQGAPIAGADQARLEVPQVQPANGGEYHLVASNSLGVATSTLARLTVLERPRFTAPVLSRMGIRGQELQIPVQVAGTQPIDVQWSRNGQSLPGQGSTLVLTNLQSDSAGVYQVIASNAFGGISETLLVVMQDGKGRVVAWGDSVAGQGRVPQELQPLEAVAVAGGDYHSLALLPDGRIEGWGSNVADATRPPVERGWIDIAAGGRHSLALHESGILFGFGANDRGQTQIPAGLLRPVSFSAGEAFSLALTAQGAVFAWGDNLRGQTQLPLAVNQPRPNPTDPLRVVDVVAGRTHALALLRNGSAVGWGSNLAGESIVPAGLPPLAALAAGHRHSVALTRDGQVRAWGDNTFGQTNVPPGLTNVVRIVAGSYHSYALRSDGSIVGWGDSVVGQVDLPSSLRPVASVAAGYFHGLALEQGLPAVQWHFGPEGLRLLWAAGGILQEASSIAGPWTDVTTTGTEWQLPVPGEGTQPMRLFRLR